jgi:hypothetical protein
MIGGLCAIAFLKIVDGALTGPVVREIGKCPRISFSPERTFDKPRLADIMVLSE